MKQRYKQWYSWVLSHFLRGLLFIAPAFVTVYALYLFFRWADQLLDTFFPNLFPGTGIILLFAFITLTGFLTNLFLFKWIMVGVEGLMQRTPITKLIYSSIKELFTAFLSERKKMFSEPVMVLLFRDAGIYKLGFVTQSDLSAIGIKDMIAVYFPHSYNFSGNLYLVPSQNIVPLPNFNPAEAMKFIVSGGMTEIGATASAENQTAVGR